MSSRPWLAHYDPGVPAHLDYPAVPVFHFLDEAARRCPQRACLIFKAESLTYRQVADQTDRLAAALSRLGIRKGERIGIFMPNCPEFVLAYFAILKAGAVVVATNPLYTPPEIVHQVNDAGLTTLFCAANLYERIKLAQPATALRRIIVTGAAIPQSGDLLFSSLLAANQSDPQASAPIQENLSSGILWYFWPLWHLRHVRFLRYLLNHP